MPHLGSCGESALNKSHCGKFTTLKYTGLGFDGRVCVAFHRRQRSCIVQNCQGAENTLPHTCFKGGLGVFGSLSPCIVHWFCSSSQQMHFTLGVSSGLCVLAQDCFIKTFSSMWKLCGCLRPLDLEFSVTVCAHSFFEGYSRPGF